MVLIGSQLPNRVTALAIGTCSRPSLGTSFPWRMSGYLRWMLCGCALSLACRRLETKEVRLDPAAAETRMRNHSLASSLASFSYVFDNEKDCRVQCLQGTCLLGIRGYVCRVQCSEDSNCPSGLKCMCQDSSRCEFDAVDNMVFGTLSGACVVPSKAQKVIEAGRALMR